MSIQLPRTWSTLQYSTYLSMAWSSVLGFHQGSSRITTEALVKFSPTPPALTVNEIGGKKKRGEEVRWDKKRRTEKMRWEGERSCTVLYCTVLRCTYLREMSIILTDGSLMKTFTASALSFWVILPSWGAVQMVRCDGMWCDGMWCDGMIWDGMGCGMVWWRIKRLNVKRGTRLRKWRNKL